MERQARLQCALKNGRELLHLLGGQQEYAIPATFEVQPIEWHLRKAVLQRLRTAAHLDHQNAVIAQVFFSLGQNPDDQVQDILAAIETHFWLGKVFRWQLLPLGPGDIGWIADDNGIFFFR